MRIDLTAHCRCAAGSYPWDPTLFRQQSVCFVRPGGQHAQHADNADNRENVEDMTEDRKLKEMSVGALSVFETKIIIPEI